VFRIIQPGNFSMNCDNTQAVSKFTRTKNSFNNQLHALEQCLKAKDDKTTTRHLK
jgi:hypothetical protein